MIVHCAQIRTDCTIFREEGYRSLFIGLVWPSVLCEIICGVDVLSNDSNLWIVSSGTDILEKLCMEYSVFRFDVRDQRERITGCE